MGGASNDDPITLGRADESEICMSASSSSSAQYSAGRLPSDPLLPIPIDAYRAGNTGVAFAHKIDSGRNGPAVAITALIHGNEVCGAHALDRLLRSKFRPRQGSLLLIFCNTAAYAAFDPEQPGASRFVDEDMNRIWDAETLKGNRHSAELERARQLRPLIDQVDLLLDIHSMQTPSPALMLSGLLPKGRDLAAAIGVPEMVVADAGHKAGLRLRDYGGFGDPASPKNAVLVECGQHWNRASAATAWETLVRFLLCTGIADAADAEALGIAPSARPVPQRFIEVTEAITIASDKFRFEAEYFGLECIEKSGTIIAKDDDRLIRTPYDNCVLIMPTRRVKPGQTAVRLGRFIG